MTTLVNKKWTVSGKICVAKRQRYLLGYSAKATVMNQVPSQNFSIRQFFRKLHAANLVEEHEKQIPQSPENFPISESFLQTSGGEIRRKNERK